MHQSSFPPKKKVMNLEPQTTIYKWLFQLDDSKSLYRKCLFHQTTIYKWLFGVPGTSQGCRLLGPEKNRQTQPWELTHHGNIHQIRRTVSSVAALFVSGHVFWGDKSATNRILAMFFFRIISLASRSTPGVQKTNTTPTLTKFSLNWLRFQELFTICC